MRIADHFLCRTANVDYESIHALQFEKTLGFLQEIEKRIKQQRELSVAIADEIHAQLSDMPDAIKSTLIVLRRDIYNHRHLKKKQLDHMSQYAHEPLVAPLIKQVTDYQALTAEVHDMQTTLAFIFEQELVEKRVLLTDKAQHDHFLNAVWLTKANLLKQFKKYASSDLKSVNKSRRQTESSVMSFYNRAAMKTTPFASFTGLSVGLLSEGNAIDLVQSSPRSIIKLNRSFIYTITHKLSQLEQILLYLKPRLNNTLKQSDGYYTYFKRGRDGTWDAFKNESRSRLKSSQQIEDILIQCDGNNQVHDILKKYPDSYALLMKLEKAQVIHIDFQIPDQTDDYLAELLNQLHMMPHHGDPYAQYLAELHQLESKISHATVPERQILVQSLKENIEKLDQLLSIDLTNYTHEKNIIYDDMIFSKTDHHIGRQQFDAIDFEQLSKIIACFDDTYRQRILFKNFFIAHYGVGGKCQNILDFYQFYRSFSDEERYAFIKNNLQAKDKQFLSELDACRNKIKSALSQHDDVAEIDAHMLSDINDLFEHMPGYDSLALFIQPDQQGGWVLDRAGCGFGKYFSRFHYLFNKQDVIESIQSCLNDTIHCDLQANLGINVNIHPNILGADLEYPGCQSAYEDEHRITLNDVSVIHDTDSDSLVLRDKQQRDINLIQHGFLFPRLGPKLYNFLCWFTPPGYFDLNLWDLHEGSNEVQRIPCVKFQNITLARGGWIVPNESLPQKTKQMSDLAYFTLVNQWISEHQLSTSCFIRSRTPVLSQDMPNNMQAWIEMLKSNKKRKPQFFDFKNALNMANFQRIVSENEHGLILQDLCPTPFPIKQNDTKHHAVEILVELYKDD